jgi:erythromycin esterase-like protein
MLTELHGRQQDYALKDGERFLDAEQNARVVANAERYYRIMYYGSRASWNLRDRHMFETLQHIMARVARGEGGRMGPQFPHRRCLRDRDVAARRDQYRPALPPGFGKEAYAIGFGTDHGTVAAASDWGGEMEVKQVRPSHPQSHEWCFHRTNVPGCCCLCASIPTANLRGDCRRRGSSARSA